jgi:hypothetical protein
MQILKLYRRLRFINPSHSFTSQPLFRGPTYRQMSSPTSRKVSIPHTVRTAAEPRQNRLFAVRLSHIELANPTIRLLQLTIPPSVQDPELQDQLEECYSIFVFVVQFVNNHPDWPTTAPRIFPWTMARCPYSFCCECRRVQYHIYTCRCTGTPLTGTFY